MTKDDSNRPGRKPAAFKISDDKPTVKDIDLATCAGYIS